MPFKLPSIPGKSSSDQSKQEPSLDDILPNTNQRHDLISLVATCTDHMRDNLTSALDDGTLSKSASRTSNKSSSVSEVRDSINNIIQQARRESQRSQSAERGSSSMQDLERAGTKYHDRWQQSVLERMGEALSLKSDIVKNPKTLSPILSNEDVPPPRNLPFPGVVLPSDIQELDEKKRALVLGAVLFMLLSLEKYPAHSRVLMAYLCQCFELSYDVLTNDENTTAATLLEAAYKAEESDPGMDGEAARQKQADKGARDRKWKIGLATVAGAAVIGITGGLAAPLLIGIAGTVLGGVGLGGLATLLGVTLLNPVTIATLFGALGGRMTSRAMSAYSKEVQDFKFLPIDEDNSIPEEKRDRLLNRPAMPAHKLRLAIGVSGWVVDESDITRPWQAFSAATLEAFALQYEKEAMITLGSTLSDFLQKNAYSMARSGAIRMVAPALSEAFLPVALLRAGKIIDNPFTIAMERSDKAGQVLAQALMDKVQGERPVTLVGFSLGARVVFSCLEELAAHNAFGLVENAVLIGGPIPSTQTSWRRMRAMVVGRLINVYTQSDMILGYLYRARNLQFGIAGLSPITSVSGVENKDASDLVTGHNQYRLAIGPILQDLNFADLDLDQVQRERDELEKEKAFEQRVHDQAKQEGRLDDVEDEQGQLKMVQAKEEMERTDTRTSNSNGNGNGNLDSDLARHESNRQELTEAEILQKNQEITLQNMKKAQIADAGAQQGEGPPNDEKAPALPPRRS